MGPLTSCVSPQKSEQAEPAEKSEASGDNKPMRPEAASTTPKDTATKSAQESQKQTTEALLAQLVSILLEDRHLRRKPIDNNVSKAAYAAFIESLDPGKLFLLQEDIDALQPYAETIDDQLRKGSFELAFEGGTRVVNRITAIRKAVGDMLAEPFNLEDDSTYDTDSEKRVHATTMAELQERWRKTLQLQAIRQIEAKLRDQEQSASSKDEKKQSKSPKTSKNQKEKTKANTEKSTDSKDEAKKAPKSIADIEREVRERLAKRYDARFKRLTQLEPLDKIERLVDALAEVYDPHTSYLPPARKEDFDIRMSGKLEGIGAVLQENDDVIKVARIVPGSASDRQGDLKAEDNIIAVAQGDNESVDIVGMRLRDAVRLIRGPKGTTVKLTVRKPDERILVIPIVRDVVRLEATWARAAIIDHPTAGATGYIELPSFYGSTGQRRPGEKPRTSSGDIRRALEAFNDKKVTRLVLDLRNNGGGYLSDARRMAGLFIKTGPIVQTRTADGEIDALVDNNPDITFTGRVVVLVDHQSASASEIVAGALKDYGRAIIIGTKHTHGKGTVQTLLSLDDLANRANAGLGVMKITQAQFYRVNGESTQLRGVVPDIVLPDPTAYVDSGEAALDRAIPWDAIKKAKYTPWDGKQPDIDALRQKSSERVKRDPALTRVDKRVAVLKKQIDNSVYPLSLERWKQRREADDKALDALSAPDDEKPLFSAAPVYYSGAPSDSEKTTLTEWSEAIRNDPWLNEALHVIGDMESQQK
jgi:carboxyl-terminal processing protease